MADRDLERADVSAFDNQGLLAAGLAFLGTGVAMGVVMSLRRRQGVAAWLIPGLLVILGTALVGTSAAARYGVRVDETEQRVREELGQLDPFARVKVLKDLAEEQVPSWLKRSEEAPTS